MGRGATAGEALFAFLVLAVACDSAHQSAAPLPNAGGAAAWGGWRAGAVGYTPRHTTPLLGWAFQGGALFAGAQNIAGPRGRLLLGRRCPRSGGAGALLGSSLGHDSGAPPSELKTTTIDWLLQRTRGHSAQFDVILQTSTDRINLQAKLLELKSRRAQVQRMRDNNAEMLREMELLGERPGGDHSLSDDAREELSRSRASLDEARAAHEQLAHEEAALAAESIRLELDSERARQILKLHSLLQPIEDHHGFHHPPADPPAPEEEEEEEEEAAPAPAGAEASDGGEAAAGARTFLGAALGLDGARVDALCEADPRIASRSVESELRPLVDTLSSYLGGGGGAAPPRRRLGRAVQRRPAVLAEASAAAVEGAERLLEGELGMSRCDAASLVERLPWVLSAEAQDAVRTLVAALHEGAGLGPAEVGGMLASHAAVARTDAGGAEQLLELLREEAGLRRPAQLGALLQRCPRLLVRGDGAEVRRTVRFLRDEVGLSQAALAKVAAQHPQLLASPLEGGLRKTHEWLVDLEVPPARIERIVRSHPKALGYRVEGKLSELGDFLMGDLGLARDKAGAVVARFPQILGLSVADNLRPTAGFLVNEVGVPRDAVGKVALAFPQVLGLSVACTLRPHVAFLRDELGVPPERLGKVVASFPHVLAYCLESNLRPTLDFLHEEVGVPRASLGKLVASHPQILGYSVATKLRPTVGYLVEEVGVPSHRIPMLVERCPKLLGCSVSRNLRPTVSFFREELGLDGQQVCNIMTKYPALMGLSVDRNLRPKLDYLTKQLGIPRGDLEAMVGTCPQLLAYSLEKRIKPRHRLLEGRGLKLGLHSMLAPSDLTFYQRYGEGLSSMTQVCPRPEHDSGNYYWHPSASLPVQPKPRKARKPRAAVAVAAGRRHSNSKAPPKQREALGAS